MQQKPSSEKVGSLSATFRGKTLDTVIIDEYYDTEIPAAWYDEPEDQMAVFLGFQPRPEAKYTIPEGENPRGDILTWEQRFRPKIQTADYDDW